MADAVILAGGHTPRELRDRTPYKACLTIGEDPMILPVIRALCETPSVERVIVLAPKAVLNAIDCPDRVILAEGGATLTDTLRRALTLARRDRPILLAASDIPLLTASAVEYFCQSARRERADLAYPIVRKEILTALCPHAHRTYVRLKDGTFTGGNLLYIGGGVSESLLAFADRIFRARKRPWRIAALFGLRFCLAFLLGRLGIGDIEQHLAELWGRRCRALIMPYPELAMDVDKLSDYHAIQTHIKQTTS